MYLIKKSTVKILCGRQRVVLFLEMLVKILLKCIKSLEMFVQIRKIIINMYKQSLFFPSVYRIFYIQTEDYRLY